MEVSQILSLAWAAFAIGFISAVALIGCLLVLSRKLAAQEKARPAVASLSAIDVTRIGRLVWGVEKSSAPAVGRLLWAVRLLWVVVAVSVVAFAVMIAGAA